MKSAAAEADDERFREARGIFRKYREPVPPRLAADAAQGYQESRLDQQRKSHVGAIGVMQVMPATGKELKVGDITQSEPNIHAA